MIKFINSFLTIIFLTLNLTAKTNLILNNESIEMTNQIENSKLCEEILSENQTNSVEINGFSTLDLTKSYGNSTYYKANIINYDIESKTTSFEYFDMNSYPKRNLNKTFESSHASICELQSIDKDSSIESTEEYVPQDMQYDIMPTDIIGGDNRKRINNTRSWPYRGIARIETTFEHVYNSSDKKYYDFTFTSSGFMEGPDLLVGAGHSFYKDVTSGGDYEDNIKNYRFPDRIKVYAGVNGKSEITDSYIYYAEVKVINIQKEYYEKPNFNYDWAALQLDRNLGNLTGYYGKIGNWYSENYEVYSYGYPGDKNGEMWEAHGNLVRESTYRYYYDFDTVSGQSGSPIFMVSNTGKTYVCGTHTSGDSNGNGGTRFNLFIFHYLNSFVSHHNFEHYVATIAPKDYKFADAYPTDDETKNNYTEHKLEDGFTFRTKRYRTGYIQKEYIVMSPFRKGITEAFIEYNFDEPVSKIDVDLSHWRSLSHEWTYDSNCNAVIRIKDSNNYITAFDLLAFETELPTDRTCPKTYTIVFPKPTYSFEFYMKSLRDNTNDDNRGRICIGNMDIYTIEGP